LKYDGAQKKQKGNITKELRTITSSHAPPHGTFINWHSVPKIYELCSEYFLVDKMLIKLSTYHCIFARTTKASWLVGYQFPIPLAIAQWRNLEKVNSWNHKKPCLSYPFGSNIANGRRKKQETGVFDHLGRN